MARYIEAVKTAEIISEKLNIPLGDLVDIFAEIPTAEVVDFEKIAEILRNMFGDDCACNYNGYDEWLPMKCKYAETDCPMPKERLGCWKEFVKYFIEQLDTRTPKERGGGEMNTLEHYIVEIHSEKQDEKYPDMLEVDVTYNCYGSKQRTTHLTFKERWEIDKQRGYFMA